MKECICLINIEIFNSQEKYYYKITDDGFYKVSNGSKYRHYRRKEFEKYFIDYGQLKNNNDYQNFQMPVKEVIMNNIQREQLWVKIYESRINMHHVENYYSEGLQLSIVYKNHSSDKVPFTSIFYFDFETQLQECLKMLDEKVGLE